MVYYTPYVIVGGFFVFAVGGWLNQPILKNMHKSKWIISPNRDEHKNIFETPSS